MFYNLLLTVGPIILYIGTHYIVNQKYNLDRVCSTNVEILTKIIRTLVETQYERENKTIYYALFCFIFANSEWLVRLIVSLHSHRELECMNQYSWKLIEVNNVDATM